jgi:Ankyrin repeats (3 copies)
MLAMGDVCMNLPLHVAASSGQSSIASFILSLPASYKVNPKVANRHGETVLMLSCKTGLRDIVQMLLKDSRINMADLDAVDEYWNVAMMHAAKAREVDIFIDLVKAGADWCVHNDDRMIPELELPEDMRSRVQTHELCGTYIV